MTIAKFIHGAVRSISQWRALALGLAVLVLSAATAEALPYRLAWDRNTDGLTTGYRVYYGTAPGAYQPANGTDVGNALEFTADLTPGATYFFVVRAYSSTNLGPPSAELMFTVPLGASVIVNTASVAPGTTVTASVTGGPGNRQDWVGFFPTGAQLTGWTDWKYLNGSRTAPATGVTSSTVSFVAPSTPGAYAVRFYSSTNVLLASSVSVTVGGSPSVSGPTSSVSAGQSFSVAVANGPASRFDLVALYPASSTSTSAYIAALYLNGSPNPPATGMSSADVPFTAPQQAGQYNLRFFNNNTTTPTATSVAITVTSGTSSSTSTAPSVTPSATSVPSGGNVTVQVRNGPAGKYDWVAMYPAGGTAFVDWFYLNGTKSAPSSGIASANIVFTMPTNAGQYQIFLFENGYSLLASTAAITVTNTAPPPPTGTNPSVTPSATIVARGSLITVTVANGPGLIYDWVTMYASGQSGANWSEWSYLNGTKTAPSTAFRNATFSFKVPMTPGTYVLRFQTNSYTLVANSVNIVVY